MSLENNKIVDYFFIQELFDVGFNYGKGWKSHYFREAQNCFKKNYTQLNKWRPNQKDPKKWGHYNDENLWSWTNRINTHPNCCLSFYNWAIKYNPNIFTEFGNPDYHEHNAKQMWGFIDEFFELIFTTNRTDKYLRELKVKCQKSWNNGNITVIAILMSLRDSFGEISDLDYTFDYGDGDDMNGIDLSFKLPTGELKTIQIKSGTFQEIDNKIIVKGSPNDLSYKTDYYGYAGVDSWRGSTSVILFNNTPNLYKENKNVIVNGENVIYKKIKHMGIPEKLNDLLVFCGKKDIEFTIIKEDESNHISFDKEKNKITLVISNTDDSNLEKLIDDKILELKEMFK
jgi:hypothetical protein